MQAGLWASLLPCPGNAECWNYGGQQTDTEAEPRVSNSGCYPRTESGNRAMAMGHNPGPRAGPAALSSCLTPPSYTTKASLCSSLSSV